MKSRKGKKASRKIAVASMEKVINDKFSSRSLYEREELFKQLELWAMETLTEEARQIFIEALYNAEMTQDVRIIVELDRILSN